MNILNIVREKGWTKLYAKPNKVYTYVESEFMCSFNVDDMEEESEDYLKHMCVQVYYNIEERSKVLRPLIRTQ